MPTFNAEKYLRQSIESIYGSAGDIPIEILVADGGSDDETISILKQLNVRVISNPQRIAEYGKYLAFKETNGEYIVFIDADNIIGSTDWLEKILIPFSDNESLLGVESNYLISKDFSSLNTYLALLVIVDPLARMLSSRPRITKSHHYITKEYRKGSSPISGANGFVWRKSVLGEYLAAHPTDTLEESNILNTIAKDRVVRIGNVPNTGIFHFYTDNVKDYILKRRKIANKFLDRQKRRTTWVDTRNASIKLFAVIYLASIIGPTLEASYNSIRTRRIEWFWHPLICWLTIATYAFYFIRDKLADEKPIT